MSERVWRNVFIVGTLIFLAVLMVMTVDSLHQVTRARTPSVTAEVAAGKRVWQRSNCNDCHTMLGIGGYFAPDLTKVVDRRGAGWIHRWLLDGQTVIPGNTMPDQHLSRTEATHLVSFLEWVGKIDTNNWPPRPTMTVSGPAGPALFDQKGCSGCHMIGGHGSTSPGPDLSHIGSRPYDNLPNSPQALAAWLHSPQSVKPDTPHPQLSLEEAEIDALVDYLSGLK